jgi:lipopolysaccharide export system permease protein
VKPPLQKFKKNVFELPSFKIIYWYLIKKFIPPFFLTFFLALLIILMQFLWKYVDDLVGKGLDWYLILELLFYASATFVSLALPLAVLLSSLMTFGSLGEKYEIVALKSAGVSVSTLMRPLAFIALFIAFFSFWFSDNILPMANVKMKTLLYEIREQKPALAIPEGSFYDGFGDYTIRIGKKYRDNENIEDIIIYDHSRRHGNNTVTYAKKGKMTMTSDKQYFLFTLYDGYHWDESRGQNSANSDHPLFFIKFKSQYMKLDLSPFNKQKTDESFFKSSNKSLKMKELSGKIDTMETQLQRSLTRISERYFDQTYFFSTNILSDSTFKIDSTLPASTFGLSSFPKKEQLEILNFAQQKSLNFIDNIEPAYEVYKMDEQMINLYIIEWHRKIVLSLACFLFFFLGAPLGTIIRKGGIGIPLVITVIFFAFYFVISIIGEKMAKSSDFPVWFGMWLSTFIIIPLGIFLTYKATTDSAVMSSESYMQKFNKIITFFSKR